MSDKITLYVSNAFSLSMLDREEQSKALGKAEEPRKFKLRVPRPATLDECIGLIYQGHMHGDRNIVSAIGHADTAVLFSNMLEFDLPPQRASIQLAPQDVLIVGQYMGPRLPEGCTKLPEGADIQWWLV